MVTGQDGSNSFTTLHYGCLQRLLMLETIYRTHAVHSLQQTKGEQRLLEIIRRPPARPSVGLFCWEKRLIEEDETHTECLIYVIGFTSVTLKIICRNRKHSKKNSKKRRNRLITKQVESINSLAALKIRKARQELSTLQISKSSPSQGRQRRLAHAIRKPFSA